MKRIYDKQAVSELCKKAQIDTITDCEDICFFGCEYRKGEYLCYPSEEEKYLQIVISGEISIYTIREDGMKYSLTQGKGLFVLGDMEFYQPSPSLFFAEALTDTVSLAISLDRYRERLKRDIRFMNFLVDTLSRKMLTILSADVSRTSLKERVLNYLTFQCEHGVLDGLEKNAFRLHCSSRQLLRVMTSLEQQGLVKKCGKGKYRLIG